MTIPVTYKQVIGVDPGPTTGIALLGWRIDPGQPAKMARREFMSCSDSLVVEVVSLLCLRGLQDPNDPDALGLAIERFVVGTGSMRSGKPGAATRDLIGALCGMFPSHQVAQRAAGVVKPWATNKRLDAAGLLAPTTKMTDARDAARHALFYACHNFAPDPLSRKAVEVNA